jgi:uncharacterized membrane protein (DUF2068 family)
MGVQTNRPTPLGVSLIALFYVFGAFVLLAALVFNSANVGADIAQRHGLSPDVGVWALIAVAALALVMAYGLFRGQRWGFYLALIYLLYFAAISLVNAVRLAQPGQPIDSLSFGNFTWSALVLVYLVYVRWFFLSRE